MVLHSQEIYKRKLRGKHQPMRRFSCALLLVLPAGGHGFGFSVGAGQKQCFDEPAKSSERIAGEWRVMSGGLLDLDVTVRPLTLVVWQHAAGSAAGRSAHLYPTTVCSASRVALISQLNDGRVRPAPDPPPCTLLFR